MQIFQARKGKNLAQLLITKIQKQELGRIPLIQHHLFRKLFDLISIVQKVGVEFVQGGS